MKGADIITKVKKLTILGLVSHLMLIILVFISPAKLNGRWYLYNGNDINTDSNIKNQLNSKDYIKFSNRTMESFQSDSKNSVSEMKVLGNKMHVGDAVYKYDINKIGEHKILVLELIGFDNVHLKESVENSAKFIYVFEESIDFE
ncbi:hypothetical protein [Clostridium intestinale]|uniref:hypothetical protein n=1 Tax=Clostridium intestinale TaxID=36845 RepID=UPI002DD65E0D|nr:hypothetical protein [Clostridium intestinale]WRY52141.1 hypothetical protein P8F83_02875 [Clostridium intestinale]